MLKSILIAIFTIFTIGCSNKNLAKNSYKNNKVIIYYVHREGCPACMYMDSVLKQNDIKNSLKKEFKLIKVEIDNQSKLPDSSMRTNKTPTLYFVKNGRQIHRPINAVDANHFREILKELR